MFPSQNKIFRIDLYKVRPFLANCMYLKNILLARLFLFAMKVCCYWNPFFRKSNSLNTCHCSSFQLCGFIENYTKPWC